MTTTAKTIITAVLLLLTLCLFAQDSTKSGLITDIKTFIPNLWPNEQKASKDKQRQIELDYLAKAKRIDPNQDWLTGYSFVHRLNLNALDKFDELGVRREYILASHGTSYKEHALQAQVIVVGTVEDVTVLDEKQYRYNIINKITIEKIVAGENYLPQNTKAIYVPAHMSIGLNKGEKGLIFLTRALWFDLKLNWLKKGQKLNDIVFKPETFLTVFYSSIRIKDNENGLTTHYEAKDLPYVYDKETKKYKLGVTLEQIIDEVKRIHEINDAYNFFNREYK